jgi:hypothetical protein
MGGKRWISLSDRFAADSSIFLTPNPYQDKVMAELRRETPAYGGLKDHGDGEEVLFDLCLAGELPEAFQHHDRCVGLRPLSGLFARPFD